MLTEAASSAIAAPTAPAATPMEPEQDFPTPATPGSEIEQKYVPMSTASSSLRQGSLILLKIEKILNDDKIYKIICNKDLIMTLKKPSSFYKLFDNLGGCFCLGHRSQTAHTDLHCARLRLRKSQKPYLTLNIYDLLRTCEPKTKPIFIKDILSLLLNKSPIGQM